MNIYKEAIEHYGENFQKCKVIEELEELKVEITKEIFNVKGASREHIIEELADVYNVLEYVKILYNVRIEELHGARYQKLDRLAGRIEKDKEKKEM